jgi:hypothetical protein
MARQKKPATSSEAARQEHQVAPSMGDSPRALTGTSIFSGLDLDFLLDLEAEFCRAHKRSRFCSASDGSPIASVGRMVGKLLARYTMKAADADGEFLKILDGERLPVKTNAFKQFRRGKCSTVTERAQVDWLKRARICVQVLLNGTTPLDENPERKEVIDRIVEFFFPDDEAVLTKKEDWFFNPAFSAFENPMSYRESESELRALKHFAKDGPDACRIVRVSGWDSFWGRNPPGPDSPVSVLTAECCAAGVETIFIVPKAKAAGFESDAEQSADAFVRAFPDLPRNGIRIIKLPWDFGCKFSDAHVDGRPPISFLTRFFRWNYYKCPAERKGEVVESLLVFRQLIRSEIGNFAFSPSQEEIASFRRWLERVLRYHEGSR